MYAQLLPLTFYLFITSILQTLINFTNPTSTTTRTLQQCADGGYIDFCCMPLDLDLSDDRGYGWFHAEQASVQDLGTAAEILSAVYRDAPTLAPCYGEAVAIETSHVDWKSPVYGQEPYVSGVLIENSFRPMFARKRMPNAVVREPMLFKDAGGKVVSGKPFGSAMGLNATYVAMR